VLQAHTAFSVFIIAWYASGVSPAHCLKYLQFVHKRPHQHRALSEGKSAWINRSANFTCRLPTKWDKTILHPGKKPVSIKNSPFPLLSWEKVAGEANEPFLAPWLLTEDGFLVIFDFCSAAAAARIPVVTNKLDQNIDMRSAHTGKPEVNPHHGSKSKAETAKGIERQPTHTSKREVNLH
jgi:hypothetical protein